MGAARLRPYGLFGERALPAGRRPALLQGDLVGFDFLDRPLGYQQALRGARGDRNGRQVKVEFADAGAAAAVEAHVDARLPRTRKGGLRAET